MRATVPILLSFLLFTAPLAAQVTTGSIDGYVLAVDGTPLRDAEVVVTGRAVPGPRIVQADALGRFFVPLLPAGAYRVLIRRIGYRPMIYEDVPVRLATTVRLPASSLEESPVVLEAIIVQASTLTLDFQSTAVQTTFNGEALDALPVDRELTAAAGLAPGANTSFYGDGVNFGGSTGTENTWYVDGVNVTDPLTGAPGMRLPSFLIEQVEIRSGVYEASLGQGLGTVINAVTPSGGNTLSIRGYGFLSNDGMAAGAREGRGQVTGFTDIDGGLSIGGPLRRDRLWFFAAYNPLLSHQNIEVTGVPSQDGRREVHAFAGKLTWGPSPATTVDLVLLGDPGTRREVASVDSAVTIDPILTTTRTGGVNLSLRGSHRVNSAVLLEITGQRYHSRDDREGTTPAGRNQPIYTDFSPGIGAVSGGIGMHQRLRSTRWTVGAQALLLAPRHTIRIGAEIERTRGEALFEALDTLSGGFITNQGNGNWDWLQFYFNGVLTNTAPSIFAQDAWQLHPRLLATAGLRWEQQRMRTPGNTRINLSSGLQPRLGLIYQPGQLGVTKVYASYGRFVERTALWLGSILSPVAFYRDTLVDHDPRQDTWPYQIGSAPGADYAFHAQAVHEFSAGVERRFSGGVIGGIRGVARDLEWVIEDGSDGVIYSLGNPGRGKLAGLPRARRNYRAMELTLRSDERSSVAMLLSYTLSRTRGNYTGLYATDADLPAPHSGPQFDTPEQLINGSGLLPNDRTHQFRAVASRRFGGRLGAGAVLWWASGTPTSELGPIPGSGYLGFLSPRGSAGRTPAIWDLDLRLTWDLLTRGRTRSTLLLDIQHLPNSRTAVEEQQQAALTTFGKPTAYQPPRRVRAGLRVEF